MASRPTGVISAEVLLNESQFTRAVTRHVKKYYVRPTITNMVRRFNQTKEIHHLIVDGIKRTNTWAGLLGAFAGDTDRDWEAILGLEDSFGVIDELEDFLLEAIEIIPLFSDPAGILFGFMSNDKLEAMFQETFASYVSDTSGETIEWLKWLILQQNDPVINYDILFASSGLTTSRSGRAIMVKEAGAEWNISAHDIGDKNFMQEGLDSPTIQEDLSAVLEKEMRSSIRKIGTGKSGGFSLTDIRSVALGN